MKEARRADRFTQLALAAGDEALAQAGIADSYDGDDVACVIGTGIGGIGTIEEQHSSCASAARRPSRRWPSR